MAHYKGNEILDMLHKYGAAKDFCKGNIVKYVMRFEQKGGVEDLRKAATYLEYLIKISEPIEGAVKL